MINTENIGYFVISLDFELHWGVFDALDLKTYRSNLLAVPEIIERLLVLSENYGIQITFATVGFLFADSKEAILKFSPQLKPSYSNSNLNPYPLLNKIGKDEVEDPLHYARTKIDKITKSGCHEISSHTYSHYNCSAEGQDIKEFEADIKAASNIAKSCGIELKSIVFPKNQVVKEYLEVCKKYNMTSFRGNENSILYNDTFGHIKAKFPLFRMLRLIDTYFNISGYHTYDINKINNGETTIWNIPSSRFLRHYQSKLSILEPLKIKRITKAMEHAAKTNEIYHLWWHPHNFGNDLDKNFNNLEKIFIKFSELRETYGFESITMTGLSDKMGLIQKGL